MKQFPIVLRGYLQRLFSIPNLKMHILHFSQDSHMNKVAVTSLMYQHLNERLQLNVKFMDQFGSLFKGYCNYSAPRTTVNVLHK